MGGACVNNPQYSGNRGVRARSFRTNRTYKGLAPRVATKPATTNKLVGSIVEYPNQKSMIAVVPPPSVEVQQPILQVTPPPQEVIMQPVVQQIAQPVSFIQQPYPTQPMNLTEIIKPTETLQQQPVMQMVGGSSRVMIRPTSSMSIASPKGFTTSVGATAIGNSLPPQNLSMGSPPILSSPVSMTRQQIPAMASTLSQSPTPSAIPTLSVGPSNAAQLPPGSRNSIHTSVLPGVSAKMVTSITSNNYPPMLVPTSTMESSQRQVVGPLPPLSPRNSIRQTVSPQPHTVQPLPPLSPRNDVSFKMAVDGPIATLHSNPPIIMDAIRESVIPSTIPLPVNSNTKSMTAGYGILINDFVNDQNFNPALYRPLSMENTRLQLI